MSEYKLKHTYLNVGFGTSKFLLIKLLSGLLVRRVLQVRSEHSKVILFFLGVLRLRHIKLSILTFDLLLNHACVAHANVVVSTAGNLLAHLLQSLRRCPQLSRLLDLEAFGLLAHIFEEYCQVGRDAVRTL